jgi:hypothetical protein
LEKEEQRQALLIESTIGDNERPSESSGMAGSARQEHKQAVLL